MRDHLDALDPLNLRATAQDIHRIPQGDRVKLAMLLIRDLDQGECIMPLRRLANQADQLSSTLMRDRFERECG